MNKPLKITTTTTTTTNTTTTTTKMISQQRSPLLGRMLSLIEMPSISLRFLILDCPTESTLPFYLEEFKKYNITHIIRCCQPTYSTGQFTEQGIQVHDLPFKDGGVVSLIIKKKF